MKKLALAIVLLFGFLSIIFWRAWPKDMPFPDAEKQNLFEIKDYEKLVGQSILTAPLKNGAQCKYSESHLNDCTLRALMQNGILDNKVFNFRSMYQVCKSNEKTKTLFNEQKLMEKVPGMNKDELLADTSKGTIDFYSGNETVFITAYLNNIYYSMQIEPKITIEKDSLVKMISERLVKIKSRNVLKDQH